MVDDRWLRRLFAAGILALVVWPLPHFFLTRAITSDPWKNLGLAMYATRFDVFVAVRFQAEDGSWQRLSPEGDATRALTTFVERRRTRGRLHAPDTLARDLAVALDTKALRLTVVTQTLDGERGLLEVLARERIEYAIEPDGSLVGGPLDPMSARPR